MGLAVAKPFLTLAGKLVIEHSLELFQSDPDVAGIVLVSEASSLTEQLCQQYPKIRQVSGGRERMHSVQNGLQFVLQQSPSAWVAVHDAARPCLHREDWQALKHYAFQHQTATLLAAPVVDTLKQISGDQVQSTINREQVVRALTPQMATANLLQSALSKCVEENRMVTDEAQALELAGHPVAFCLAQYENLKITFQSDLALAERVLLNRYDKDRP